uniref:CKLF like MARVEL transmembrane domain containing 7 n=1 Tax=Poecilia latipinna TaxID=48699 RepID=A0A3B3URJ4_9TELE
AAAMSLTAISSTPSGGRSSGDGGLNLGYSRTIPGLLKIGQLLSLLVAFLCVRLARGWPNWYAFQFFEVVLLWFLVAFLIFFLMHLCRLQVKMPCINWPLAEFFHYSVGSVLIFIASIIAAVKCGAVSSLVVASVFGLIATFLMVVNLWTSYSVACGPAADVMTRQGVSLLPV